MFEWFLRLLKIDQDSLREIRIDDYRRKMLNAETPTEAAFYWKLMKREISQRSEEQIARMERERGIA